MVIKGEISNLEYPYILASYVSSDTLVLDTIEVKEKGKFKYRKEIDTLTVFTLYFNEFNNATVVFGNKADKLSIKGDARFPDLIRVSGSEINDDLTLFKTQNEDVLTQRGQLLINFQEERKNHSDSNKGVLTEIEKMGQINSLNHELRQRAEDFVKEHPSKLSSLILINDFFTNSENSKALERVLSYVDGDISSSLMAMNLKSYSEKLKQSAEGSSLPYFQLTDKEDKKVYSHQFSGKYLLLSFVSASGLESRETSSILKNAYQELNKDSVAFVSIYIDSDRYPVSYLENDSIPWTIVPEKNSWASEIVNSYNIQSVPYNILISPSGKILDRGIAAQRVENTINNPTVTEAVE
jgi:hypothetical protein